VVSGPTSVTFPTLAETSTPLVCNIIINNCVLDYTKNAYNQHGFSNVTYTTASLPRQILTTIKLSIMHFAILGIDNRKLWVVIKSIW